MNKLEDLPFFERWFILGILLGILAGIAAIIFYELLHLFEYIFLFEFIGMSYPRPIGEGGTLSFTFITGRYYLIPVSTILGGLISGIILYTITPGSDDDGTDTAIKSYHYFQGKIKWITIPVKVIAAVITIGSGGSAGREGPTGGFAAGLGSVVADFLHLSPEDRRIAVAVGVGAGIGTIFKTPIGGAILAAEILYKRDIEPEIIYPAMIASAIGYSIFGSIFGFTPVFGYYTGVFSPIRLPMYAILGVFTGLIGVLYPKFFFWINSMFKRLRIPNQVKPAIGGAVTGIIALLAPEVLATGYGWISLVEFEKFSAFYSPVLPVVVIIIALPFLKIFATGFSLGSGGSGGLFTPGIVIGAFTGASTGLLFHEFFPSQVPDIAPFVIIGMMSLFAASGKVPLSVIVMVTEMTSSLQLLPGAMIAVGISYLISGNVSIYKSQLPTRKDSPAHKSEYEVPVLERLRISSCKLKDLKVSPEDPVERARQIMEENFLMSLPVVDELNNFVGVIYLRDIEKAGKNKVANFITKGSSYVTPTSSLASAMDAMNRQKSRWVAVVESCKSQCKFLGIVTLDAIDEAYNKEISTIKNNS
ncbi:chloride channel protein [Candidatus Acidianus copahuensis]|uniref:Chloride channel protein n=1 Tax=Candidatus Acidianus copahuensis TaxID=1160895 RepID=A0A031LJR9_9CREN|nr:chloride channel protein [Candidatus Acidianus copahuensis]EZQ01791.1 chloride channel protein [Candidatus Acidianus copahuensis]